MTAELLPEVLSIAREAGAAIMEVHAGDFEVKHKEDESPLTAADLASHRRIVDGLKALTPDMPLLSEEGRDIPYAERGRWDQYWLIDPLDGTREFVKRNSDFTVNIALIRNGVPVLGVIHCPALQLDYYACEGAGAFRQDQGSEAVPIQTAETPAEPRIVASRSHRTAELEEFLGRLGPHTEASRGSSLKFCLVAEGSADFYPRLGPTSEWDTAAGQCVVEQAGGQVLELDFTPLRYNRKDSLLNPSFLVVGDPGYNWQRHFA